MNLARGKRENAVKNLYRGSSAKQGTGRDSQKGIDWQGVEMAQQRCKYGHMYDAGKFGNVCPCCGTDIEAQREKYPLSLRPGSILNGRYIVGRVLGQGGFGVTYIAWDDRNRERVAVKEFFPYEIAGRSHGSCSVQAFSDNRREYFEQGRSNFLSEAKTLAEFRGNKNIVQVYSYFEENNTAYFVMEYVDGENLKSYVRGHGGRITMEKACELLMPVMAALDAVHAKGIVHRDIAPDNILIGRGETAKLIDFGAARYSTGEKTKSLDIIRKEGFSPKEQYLRRGRQGPFTDVYSLAATIYYAITGKVPPDAISRMEEDELLEPSTLNVKMPGNSEEVLLKALEVDSADRYQTMAEFRNALQAELSGTGRGAASSKGGNTDKGYSAPNGAGKANTQKPQDVDALIRKADEAKKTNDNIKALNILLSAKAIEENNLAVLTRLGRAYRSLGQNENARAAYEQALKLSPGNPVVIGNLGVLELAEGNKAQALNYLKSAYEHSGGYDKEYRATAAANYAQALARSGNKPEGLRLLEEARSLGFANYSTLKKQIDAMPDVKPDEVKAPGAKTGRKKKLTRAAIIFLALYTFGSILKMTESDSDKSPKSTPAISALAAPTPTPTPTKNTSDPPSGRWSSEPVYLREYETSACYEFDSPIKKCTALTLNVKVSSYTGYPFDEWYLYARDLDGNWSHIAMFDLEETIKLNETNHYYLKFDKPESFDAIAIAHVARGYEFNISYNVSISDLKFE